MPLDWFFGNHWLFDSLFLALDRLGVKYMKDDSRVEFHGTWTQKWKSIEDLGLQGALTDECCCFISLLNHSVIHLKDLYDELLWSKNS